MRRMPPRWPARARCRGVRSRRSARAVATRGRRRLRGEHGAGGHRADRSAPSAADGAASTAPIDTASSRGVGDASFVQRSTAAIVADCRRAGSLTAARVRPWPSAASSPPAARSRGASRACSCAEELGYESAYVTHIAGRESLTVMTAYAHAHRADPRRHRRRADLHAHAGDDGADGRHDRRPVRRPPQPRPRRLAPAGRRGLARPDDRQAGRRDARVRRDRAGDPARRGAAGRARSGRRASTAPGSGRAPSCRSTSPRSPPGCCAWPARSPTA